MYSSPDGLFRESYAVASSDTVAKSKGYKNSSWFLAVLFFGILGLIAAAGLEPNMGAVLQTAAVRDSNESAQPVEPVTISHNKKVANRIIFIVLTVILLAVLVIVLKPF